MKIQGGYEKNRLSTDVGKSSVKVSPFWEKSRRGRLSAWVLPWVLKRASLSVIIICILTFGSVSTS